MSKLKQIEKIREELLKKRDEVFEALRLSDEARPAYPVRAGYRI